MTDLDRLQKSDGGRVAVRVRVAATDKKEAGRVIRVPVDAEQLAVIRAAILAN